MKQFLKVILIFFCFVSYLATFNSYSFAKEPVQIIATVLTASNQGSDFNLDNDAYRDKLINLFSYTSYTQIKEYAVNLQKGKRDTVELPGGYELLLNLQQEESKRVLVQVVIRKGREIFLDTVVSMPKPGVVFVGGPAINGDDLIIVVENL